MTSQEFDNWVMSTLADMQTKAVPNKIIVVKDRNYNGLEYKITDEDIEKFKQYAQQQREQIANTFSISSRYNPSFDPPPQSYRASLFDPLKFTPLAPTIPKKKPVTAPNQILGEFKTEHLTQLVVKTEDLRFAVVEAGVRSFPVSSFLSGRFSVLNSKTPNHE